MEDRNASVQLRASGGDLAICFVFGTESVEVPSGVASRSALLADLQSEIDEESSIDLPLSMDDVLAWIACARIEGIASEADDLDDDTAVRALKVSDFLQDEVTAATAAAALRPAFVPDDVLAAKQFHQHQWSDHTHTGPLPVVQCWYRSSNGHVPTQSQRDRVNQILNALPPTLFAQIIAAARPQPPAHPKLHLPYSLPRLQPALAHLLLLLPPSHHPTILSALYPSLSRDGSLHIPALPHFDYLDGSSPSRACLTTQALTAAAFAANEPAQHLATVSHSQVTDEPSSPASLQLSSLAVPLHHLCNSSPEHKVNPEQETAPKSPNSTKPPRPLEAHPCPHMPIHYLRLEVKAQCKGWEAPVSQLTTLQDLQLGLRLSPSNQSKHIDAVNTVLAALPQLGRLGLFSEFQVPAHRDEMVELLTTIRGLTMLSSLQLHGLIKWTMDPSGKGASAAAAMSQLSALGHLSQLSFRGSSISRKWSHLFVDALSALPLLRDLDFVQAGSGGISVISKLCSNSKLRELRSIAWGDCGHWKFERLPACLVALSGVTEMMLYGRECRNAIDVDVASFRMLLQAVPELRCLRLHTVDIFDEAVSVLVDVLPQMQHLTSLDVHRSVEHGDLLAIVCAASRPRARGATSSGTGMRLQHVQVSLKCDSFGVLHPDDLREVLGLLPELEHFECYCHGSVGDIVCVLESAKLPVLKRVTLSNLHIECVNNNVQLENLAQVLKQLPQLQLLEVTVDAPDLAQVEQLFARVAPSLTVRVVHVDEEDIFELKHDSYDDAHDVDDAYDYVYDKYGYHHYGSDYTISDGYFSDDYSY